jgi:diguanylate cyclase (GGDEF)-like protein/PAS domain S-box-containing protein
MPSMALDETWLAVVVAVAAIAVLSISLLGAAADSRLSRRRQQFDRARQELIEESERKLRQQNIRLDAALNNMSQGLCMFDANERIVVFNRRFLEMYRLSPEVVRPGCTFRELIEHRKQVGLLDADPETYYRAVLDDMAKGHSKHWITQNRDGRVIEARNERMPDGGWVTTHEDVTDHHRAEAQVREQKFQLDAALNNMIQGLLMFDAEGRLILCNRRFLDIYGLTGDEFTIGTATLDQLIRLVAPMRKNPPEAASHARRVIDGVASGQPVTLLTELVDGRFIAIANHPISDGRWVTTHENITDRHNAEALLRERTLELDAALENMVQGLCTFDKDGRLTLVNRRYSEMYGLGAEAIQPGMTLIEMLEQRRAVGSFSGDAAQYVAELHAGLKRGENFTAVTRTGSGRIVSVANHAMSDGRWVSTHDDITDRQQAAELLRGQKVQLDTALNNMSQGLNTFDAEGRLVLCNQRYLEMYRLSPDVVKPGCTVQDIVQARAAAGTFFRTDPDVYTGDLLDSMSRRQPAEQILETVDGRVVAVNSQPMPDGTGWVVTHEDITGRRRAEEERDRSRAFASTVIENVPATITVKDVQDLRYVLVNRAAEQQFELPRQEIIGRVAEDIFPPDISASITAHDREMLRLNAPSIVDEHPVKLPRGGDVRFISSSRTPIRDQNGKIEYILSVVEDRTQRRRAEAQIAHMAHHDALTGLPNRAAFNECLNASIEASAKDNSFFALLSLDSDRFKEINDVFGHAIGDKLLCEIAKRVQETAGGAFVARQSADEFSVITTDGSQPAAAEELADRIIAAIGQGFTIDGNQIRISISIGVAIYPADGNDVTTLNANADAALYRAKSEGRGGYRFFEADMDRRLRDRRILQQDLQSAIARSELTLHYQPQAKLNGEVIGFEALVRWHHPLRGMVPPGSFIPLAEDSGLIVTLGEWILREACREAASWPKPLHIAINLSPVQFRHGDLVALVHSVLLETGLSPSRIEFEITEGVLIGDFSRAVSILRQLKALGVRIAMDDFGTGYSSLSYLQAFPFDKIKIDQGFISNLERNQQSATIVRAVIGLARGLALPVVAEGVETKEQLAFLAKESCDQVQGYLIGRPRPIADYAEMVGRRPSQRKLTLVAS